MLISAGFALTVIGVIAFTSRGVWLALGGVLLPATAILAVTLTAAIWPALQGILLTVDVLAFFIAAMLLLARIRAAAIAPQAGGPETPSAPPSFASAGSFLAWFKREPVWVTPLGLLVAITLTRSASEGRFTLAGARVSLPGVSPGIEPCLFSRQLPHVS